MKTDRKIKIVVITGNGLRHRYFANQLIQDFDVMGIVSEVKRTLPQGENQASDAIIRKHFAERDQSEAEYFLGNNNFGIENVRAVATGESNSPVVFDFVRSLAPEFVILYGCSIIKPPLLSFYEGKMINMHLGLSPYYKGAGTNFWPLVNGQPECVGTTVHLPTLRVDAGPILHQVRPQINAKDCAHDIGCKAIIAGTDLMKKCIRQLHHGEVRALAQNLSKGRIYRNKDFNAQAVVAMWNNLSSGMLEEYLKNKTVRDSKYTIL